MTLIKDDMDKKWKFAGEINIPAPNMLINATNTYHTELTFRFLLTKSITRLVQIEWEYEVYRSC